MSVLHMGFAFDDNTNDILCSFLEQKLKIVSDVRFAYSIINKKNISEISVISNYHKEWVRTYLDNKFQYIDPVIVMALRRSSSFSWDEINSFSPDVNTSKVFSLSKDYNIVTGYTFVLHDHADKLVTLSLVINDDSKNSVGDEIKKNKNDLHFSLIEIHEKMSSFNRENSNDRNLKRELVTLKEREVLYWCSMGKTYAEIALIIAISPRTVKYHMANVTSKLGVVNAKQAIRLSMELGIIKNPESSR